MVIRVLQRLSLIWNRALVLLIRLILHKDQLRRLLLRRHEVIVLLGDEVLVTSHISFWTILLLSLISLKNHFLWHVLLFRQFCQSKVINSALSNKLLSQSALFGHFSHDKFFPLFDRIHFLVILLVSLLRIWEKWSFCEGLHFYLFVVKLTAHVLYWIAPLWKWRLLVEVWLRLMLLLVHFVGVPEKHLAILLMVMITDHLVLHHNSNLINYKYNQVTLF